jgi:hypothetical protein
MYQSGRKNMAGCRYVIVTNCSTRSLPRCGHAPLVGVDEGHCLTNSICEAQATQTNLMHEFCGQGFYFLFPQGVAGLGVLANSRARCRAR